MVPFVFLGAEKMNDLQPIAIIKKLMAENRKANRKHEQQQFSVSYTGQRSLVKVSRQDRRNQHSIQR